MPISPDASIRDIQDYIRKNGLNKGLNKIQIKQPRDKLIEDLRKRGHTTDSDKPPEAPQPKPRKKYDRSKKKPPPKLTLTERMKILGREEGGGESQVIYEGVRYNVIGTRAFAHPDTEIGVKGEYVGVWDEDEEYESKQGYIDFETGPLEEDHLERMEDEAVSPEEEDAFQEILEQKNEEARKKEEEARKKEKKEARKRRIEAMDKDDPNRFLLEAIQELEDQPDYIDVVYEGVPYYRIGDIMYNETEREMGKITRIQGNQVVSIDWVSAEKEREHLEILEDEEEEIGPLILPLPRLALPQATKESNKITQEIIRDRDERQRKEREEEEERRRVEDEPETLVYDGVEYTQIYDQVYEKDNILRKVGTLDLDDYTIKWVSKEIEKEHLAKILREEDEPDVTTSEEEDEPTTDEEVEPFDLSNPMENSKFRDYVKRLGGSDEKERAISDVKRSGAIKDAMKSERQKEKEQTEKKRGELANVEFEMGASYDIDYDELSVEGEDEDTLIEYAKWDFLTRLAKKRKDYPRIHQLTSLEPKKTPFAYRVRAV